MDFHRVIFSIIFLLLFLYPMWRIFKKAGVNPFFSLVLLVPIVGFLLVSAILAFSNWQYGNLKGHLNDSN